MTRRCRILGFSFFPVYLPPKNGGVERLYRVYSLLSERFDVTLISSGEVNGDLESIHHGDNFHEIRVPKGTEFLTAYEQLQQYSGEGDLSGPAIGLSSKKFGQLHDVYLNHYSSADIIIHDSPFLVECDLFRGFDRKTRVYNSYNCETDLYGSFHSGADQTRHIENLVCQLERELCHSADLVTTCTEEDRQRFLELFNPVAPIEIVPNGVMPVRRDDETEKEPNLLVFIGSNHKPNVDAANFIIREVAPIYPQFQFHLIGSCHAPMMLGNVTAHGLVDARTKSRLLSSALAAINPIMSGGGSSLKVADICMNGTPLLSTNLGVRGFDLRDGEHYVELSKRAFLKSLDQKLADTDKLVKLSTRAREKIIDRFTWPNIVGEFGAHLEELAGHLSLPRPYLVLNDYDSISETGGGATRTSGLCQGLAEYRRVIFLSFTENGCGSRRVSLDGRILSLTVSKDPNHIAAQSAADQSHWISTADILNYRFAPSNSRLTELFRCAASQAEQIICEHPYMAGLPRMFGVDFVYSSQNFELGLKADLLRQHPNCRELMATVREAEEFSCASSAFIVTVSDGDARQMTGNYRFAAPTIIIRNGSVAPDNLSSIPMSEETRPSAIFMGSGHGPNVDAAKWIVNYLAPSMPDVDFRLLGSVSDSVLGTALPNVLALGVVSSEEKSAQLLNSTVALNPVELGSGSNIKIADYLQHGLPVLTTEFGARGYEDVSQEDLQTANLADFAVEISSLLETNKPDRKGRLERASRYRTKLSMVEGGRQLHRAIQAHAGGRRRALYVTYRYNDLPLGGGELYVDRLVHALAGSGWFVDVVAPEAEAIHDVGRFGASFAGPAFQPVPLGIDRVRSAKFPLDGPQPSHDALARIWSSQSSYEERYFRSLPNGPDAPTLAWGWGELQERSRWCFKQAGLYAPESAQLVLRGSTPKEAWLQIISDSNEVLYDSGLSGHFVVDLPVSAGFTRIMVNHARDLELSDPRPLGLFVEEANLAGEDLISKDHREIWDSLNQPGEKYSAHRDGRRARDEQGLHLSTLRSPSTSLLSFVSDSVASYDLLITHNAIFGSTTRSLELAERAGVPSILIPHLHLDDDFYHFGDVFDACRRATRVLVSPVSAVSFLAAQGLENAQNFTPGIDTSEDFRPEHAKAFRELLGREDEFILVLGRKARAKGYHEVIAGAARVRGQCPLVVMIGPDDDGLPLPEGAVAYLGKQPREIIRGALSECLALVNMSRSESFGIVLLEAGLAKKPALANRNCAAFLDLIQDGVNGFLVTNDDLHLKLEEIIADPSLSKRLGSAAHKVAMKYDWKAIERRFVDCCTEVAEIRC